MSFFSLIWIFLSIQVAKPDIITISSEFTSNNIQASDLTTWSLFPTLSSYISTCNTYELVGGVNIFGQGGFMNRYYTNILPHYYLSIKLFVMFIDNWEASDAFQIYIDSTKIFEYFPKQNPQNYINNQCGSASYQENSLNVNLEINHTTTQFSLKFTSNLLKSSSQASWGVRNIIVSYYSCDISCNTCSNYFSYTCSSCYNLATLNLGICTCNDGYYLNVPNFNCTQMPCVYCSPCFSTCKTCAAASYDDCLTCPSNLYLEPSKECSVVCISPFITDSVNKKCISPCQSNEYVDKSTRSCMTCSSECETCYGPLPNNCLSCSAASQTFLDYKTCISQCPNGKYADVTTRTCLINCNSIGATEDPVTKQCIPFQCNSNCLTCKFPIADFCLSCNTGLVLSNNKCLGLVCHQSCLTCFGFSSNECLTCKAPKILVNNQCLDCDSSCLTCNGPSSNDCLSCDPRKLLVSKTCIDCPAPMIIYNNECISCDSSCKTCSGPNNNQCLSCNSPKLLNVSICADLVCDQNCKTCSGFTSKECLSCYDPKILVNKECVSCYSQCKTCSGPFKDNCLSCYPPKLLYQNQCLDLVCDASCLTCNGFTENDCLTCRNGSYFANNKCISCDQSCLTCNGGSKYNCTSCITNKLLTQDNQCLDLICHQTCETCFGFNFNECLTCDTSRVLINGQCLSCDVSCLTCSDIYADSCLTCLETSYLSSNHECLQYQCEESCEFCSGTTNLDCIVCQDSRVFLYGLCLFKIDLCPLNSYWNETLGACTKKCNYPYWYLKNTGNCITSCPSKGYYSDMNAKVCIKCQDNCDICDSQKNCILCSPGFYYDDNQCVSFCPDNKYGDSQYRCQECSDICLECSYYGENQCLSCKKPYYFDGLIQKCVINCSGSQYGDESSSRCEECHIDCLRCFGPYKDNCLECRDSSYYLLDNLNICVVECPYYSISDEKQKICRTCIVDNCSTCEDLNPIVCEVCQKNFYLSDGKCLPLIIVDVTVNRLYDPLVFILFFDNNWEDLFSSMTDDAQKYIKVFRNNENSTNNNNNNNSRLLENIEIPFQLFQDSDDPQSFYLNFTFSEEFVMESEIILIINYTSPPPPKYILKNNTVFLNSSSYKFCEYSQYYNVNSRSCQNKISLTPNLQLNYDNSQEIFLFFPQINLKINNKTMNLLIIDAIEFTIDVKKTDNYTYKFVQKNSKNSLQIQFQESEIGRPLLTLYVVKEKFPMKIQLNPSYSFDDINNINLLPTYILSEESKKTINSSSNATTIAEIVSTATLIVNTILNSGSSFVIRGLMLSQYIYSLAYLAIQYPPNVVEMYKSQQTSKAFDLPPLQKQLSDINKMPEIILIYKNSPFFVENYGVNMIQIATLFALAVLVKILYFTVMKNCKWFKSIYYFLNWNFPIIYTFTQINKMIMFATINLKYYNFETVNGKYNFFIAFLSFLFAFCFFVNILFITNSLKKYALEIEMPKKPLSPKKIKIADVENVILEDENQNKFHLKVENLEKGLTLINKLKSSSKPIEKIQEDPNESQEIPPTRKTRRPATIIGNMMASPKLKPKKKKIEKTQIVPLSSEQELNLFQKEKENYLKSLNMQEDDLKKNNLPLIDENDDRNNNNNDILAKLKRNSLQREMNTFESVTNLLELNRQMDPKKNNETPQHRTSDAPVVKLKELFEIKTNKNINIWKVNSLQKSLAEINKKRTMKNRSFSRKVYEYFYVPKDLADYRDKFAILHKEIKQYHTFQTYIISIDVARHISMSFLIIILMDYGMAAILCLFAVNMLFLFLLVKYQPIKSKFFMGFTIVNETFINITFAMVLTLGIFDHIDDTGFIANRINVGWVYVFSSLSLLYFLIVMTVLRFLRGFILSIKKRREQKKLSTVFTEKNLQNSNEIYSNPLSSTKKIKKNQIASEKVSEKSNEIYSFKEIDEENDLKKNSINSEINKNNDNGDNKINNSDRLDVGNAFDKNIFEEALKEFGVINEKKMNENEEIQRKELPKKKTFINDRRMFKAQTELKSEDQTNKPKSQTEEKTSKTLIIQAQPDNQTKQTQETRKKTFLNDRRKILNKNAEEIQLQEKEYMEEKNKKD